MILCSRELDILGALWRSRSGTVAEVRAQLPVALAYTTVLTVLRRLEQKGVVYHECEGRTHRFYPRIDETDARTMMIDWVVRKVFEGSSDQLVRHLLSADDSL